MTIPYLIGRDTITVMVNGATNTVSSTHVNYQALRAAIRDRQWDRIPDLVSPARAVESFDSGNIRVVDGEVLYQGRPLHNAVTTRILSMIREGFDAGPLTAFLAKLMNNPSKTAVDELYEWLERTSLPITEDGDFLAYKKVRDDYLSFHDGRTSNRIGESPELPRNQVDDNRDRTCSQGLHFCSLSYLPQYHGGRGRVMILKINPADVVSIPADYDMAKGRAWTYLILGEHKGGEHTEAFDTPVVSSEGQPIRERASATGGASTVIMGVDFGSVERLGQVRQLMGRVSASGSTSGEPDASPETGRLDGFNDAWMKRSVNLNQFTGGNLRAAVAYAQGYFEGYDRLTQQVPVTPAPVPEDLRALAAEAMRDEVLGFDVHTDEEREAIFQFLSGSTLNPNLHGSNNGYDAGYDNGVDDADDGEEFRLVAGHTGGANYRRGYVAGYLDGYYGDED